MPTFHPLSLPGVIEVRPDPFGDDRGFFSEVYRKRPLAGTTASTPTSSRTITPCRGPEAHCAACISRPRRWPRPSWSG